MSIPSSSEMAAAIRPVITALNDLTVDYLIGGSVASGVSDLLKRALDDAGLPS